jgi:Rieske Fe-S protein
MPGAFEGETVTRRRFMTASAHAGGAIAASAFLLPALGFALGPIFEEREQGWKPVASLDELPDDTYIPKVFTENPGIGEAGKTTVYLRRRNPEIDTEKLPEGFEAESVVAISTRCMHLGCPVRFVQAAERFICPCHGGVYNFRGEVDGGPPVRPLDRFYTRVRNGQVEVGPRFSVNSELERFSPRDPGEPLDGIGQYLYPSRPSIRKLSAPE